MPCTVWDEAEGLQLHEKKLMFCVMIVRKGLQ